MKNLFLSSILFFSFLLQNKAQSNFTDHIPANSIFAGVLKGKTVDTKFNFEKKNSIVELHRTIQKEKRALFFSKCS
jgi:hypothetical protein